MKKSKKCCANFGAPSRPNSLLLAYSEREKMDSVEKRRLKKRTFPNFRLRSFGSVRHEFLRKKYLIARKLSDSDKTRSHYFVHISTLNRFLSLAGKMYNSDSTLLKTCSTGGHVVVAVRIEPNSNLRGL